MWSVFVENYGKVEMKDDDIEMGFCYHWDGNPSPLRWKSVTVIRRLNGCRWRDYCEARNIGAVPFFPTSYNESESILEIIFCTASLA